MCIRDRSNFQPWYTQRSPSSSLRPKNNDAPRCGQALATSPTSPDVVLNAIRSSPSSFTLTGGQSGLASSDEGTVEGSQYWRSRLPIGVPGPTRHISSLSVYVSMVYLTPTPLQTSWRGELSRSQAVRK